MLPIFYDPLYMIVALSGLVISLAASALVNRAFCISAISPSARARATATSSAATARRAASACDSPRSLLCRCA